MTKQAHIRKTRVQPLGLEGIEKLRKIVEEKKAAKVNEVFVDLFSASGIVQVYDAINEQNREKLLKLPLAHVADICFRVINKNSAAA